MKLLSRVVSPAGFGLVVVLFFLMPFLSVSCDVPGAGKAGADYTGTHLISDDTPEWQAPDEVNELLGSPGEMDVPAGVPVLTIILVVLAAAGVAVGLAPTVRARLYGSAALAGAALVVAVVTVLVALSNLRAVLLPQAEELAGTADEPGVDAKSLLDDTLHTEPGFWVVAGLLAVILLLNVGGLVKTRTQPS